MHGNVRLLAARLARVSKNKRFPLLFAFARRCFEMGTDLAFV